MPRRAHNAGGELSETAFEGQVRGLAEFYGWRGYHTRDSRGSARGFPDWVWVRVDATIAELLIVELKTDRGRTKPEQGEWLEELGAVANGVTAYVDAVKANQGMGITFPQPRVEVHLWRPQDFDAIHARLARGRRRVEPVG
jgi:hypothetical protein